MLPHTPANALIQEFTQPRSACVMSSTCIAGCTAECGGARGPGTVWLRCWCLLRECHAHGRAGALQGTERAWRRRHVDRQGRNRISAALLAGLTWCYWPRRCAARPRACWWPRTRRCGALWCGPHAGAHAPCLTSYCCLQQLILHALGSDAAIGGIRSMGCHHTYSCVRARTCIVEDKGVMTSRGGIRLRVTTHISGRRALCMHTGACAKFWQQMCAHSGWLYA